MAPKTQRTIIKASKRTEKRLSNHEATKNQAAPSASRPDDIDDISTGIDTLQLKRHNDGPDQVHGATQISTGSIDTWPLFADEDIETADAKAYEWHARMIKRLEEADDALGNSFDFGNGSSESKPSQRPGRVDNASQTMLTSEPWLAGKLSADDREKILRAYPLE